MGKRRKLFGGNLVFTPIDDTYVYTTDYPRIRHVEVERHVHNRFMDYLIVCAHEASKDPEFMERFEAWKSERSAEAAR